MTKSRNNSQHKQPTLLFLEGESQFIEITLHATNKDLKVCPPSQPSIIISTWLKYGQVELQPSSGFQCKPGRFCFKIDSFNTATPPAEQMDSWRTAPKLFKLFSTQLRFVGVSYGMQINVHWKCVVQDLCLPVFDCELVLIALDDNATFSVGDRNGACSWVMRR